MMASQSQRKTNSSSTSPLLENPITQNENVGDIASVDDKKEKDNVLKLMFDRGFLLD